MSRPWELPASAWLDPRWNTALDLAAQVPVSPVKVARSWEKNGPGRTLAVLRRMAAGDGEIAATGTDG